MSIARAPHTSIRNSRIARALAGLILGAGSLAGCSGETCSGSLCVTVLSRGYSTEPCTSDPTQTCTYANAWFTARANNTNLTTLDPNDVSLTINGRDVGAEGCAAGCLTPSQRLIVNLLLDRSYSITQGNNAVSVRQRAVEFVNSLPDVALITVSVFASERVVPTFLWSDGSENTTNGQYMNRTDAARVIESAYQSYPASVSEAQTSLFDACARLAEFHPTSEALRGFQQVAVVFTDGADTASSEYRTADAVRDHIDSEGMRFYVIGLGREIEASALRWISHDRFYAAADTAALQMAFRDVREDLSAIFQFRALVSTRESNATGRLEVTHGTDRVTTEFRLDSPTTSSTGGVRPTSCGSATNCTSCTAMATCGWCNGTCFDGTSTGPRAGSCGGTTWAWYGSQCR